MCTYVTVIPFSDIVYFRKKRSVIGILLSLHTRVEATMIKDVASAYHCCYNVIFQHF